MTRQEVIEVLEIILEEYRDGEVFAPRLPALEAAIEMLKQPEQKKGKWMMNTGLGTMCSNCYYKLETTGLLSRCPNCGAEME